jgi:hypothetical protein
MQLENMLKYKKSDIRETVLSILYQMDEERVNVKELVNRKVQMWLSLCCIHVIIKYYELRKYTNEKNGKQSIKSNE